MRAPPAIEPWNEAIGLATLHDCRTPVELDRRLQSELERLLPDTDWALGLFADGQPGLRVRACGGAGCPLAAGSVAPVDGWPLPAGQRLPLRHRDHRLGELLVGRQPDAAAIQALTAVLAHFTAALVNLTCNAAAREAASHYCASLQALEEGIVLFQESDPEAVLARVLDLATTMLSATAGALYVLREVGDRGSGLCLEFSLGIPETLLASFRTRDGRRWPDVLLDAATQLVQRDADGGLLTLDPGCLPPMLQNLVVLPLRYHGVEAGVCLLFNAAVEPAAVRDLLGRVERFGQLGAALLHRLRLEAMTARNLSIARELQIAEVIQQRLLPTRAPATDEYEFAWCSIAAQNIGGDYLDFLISDLGDLHAVVADASGHGINSALLMSSFRSTYRADAPWSEPDHLAKVLNREVVHEVGATGMFITAAVLRIERETRRVALANAGHNPVLLYRAASRTIEPIDAHGPPLGFAEGSTYGVHETSLARGDLLLLYTDGITEATNADLDMFGDARLLEVLRANAAGPAAALLEAIRRELAGFTGRDRNDDDASILVIKAT
ncbi:MAG: PP2C family protein-serine/threonine phosphatase [Planctomycetes bacterium]|nr:PP2C family protein-serine/threonine phosphatase [Planctomycetota bacterium]